MKLGQNESYGVVTFLSCLLFQKIGIGNFEYMKPNDEFRLHGLPTYCVMSQITNISSLYCFLGFLQKEYRCDQTRPAVSFDKGNFAKINCFKFYYVSVGAVYNIWR